MKKYSRSLFSVQHSYSPILQNWPIKMALESHVSSHNFQHRSYAMLKSFIGSGLGLIFVFQTEAELLKCTSKLKTMFHFQLIFFRSR